MCYFNCLAIALASILLESSAGAADQSVSVITDQKALNDALHDMAKSHPALVDEMMRSHGMTLMDAEQQLSKAAEKGLSQSTKETIQQVVDGSPGPQPILGGQMLKI